MPDFHLEKLFKQPVIGVDEVGRGPLAGPVVSCACVFFNNSLPIEEFHLIDDSKKLSKTQNKSNRMTPNAPTYIESICKTPIMKKDKDREFNFDLKFFITHGFNIH